MNNGKNYEGVSIELGQLVWGEPQTEPIVSIDPGTGETTVTYLHTWEVSQDVRTVPPEPRYTADFTDPNRETNWDVFIRPCPVYVSPEGLEQLEQVRNAMARLTEAFAKLYAVGIRASGSAEAIVRAADRLPDEDGTVYAVKHDGPNRRERRAMARGKELKEQDPERYSSPGRMAFRKRTVY